MQCSQTTKIINTLGLHARPAMLLANAASKFQSEISIRRSDRKELIDAKSIMGLMMLAATKGTKLEIVASGTDAQDAIKELVLLIEKSFDEIS